MTPNHRSIQWLGALVATVSLLLVLPASAATLPPQQSASWQLLISPTPQPRSYIDALRELLEDELHAPVLLQSDDPSKALTPATASNHQTSRTIWLFSESTSSLNGSPAQNSKHLANFEPLVVLMEIPWCLFALKSSPALQQKDLLSWLSNLGRPARIGVGVHSGSPVMWAQALSLRTRNRSKTNQQPLQVQTQPFYGAMMLTSMLEQNVDIAISRCSHTATMSDEIAILAISQTDATRYIPNVPTFTEVGLPPLGRGWHGAFVARSMPADNKQKLIAAFEKITQSSAMRKAILDNWQVPLNINHEASRRYIDRYIQTWQAIFDLMERSTQEETAAAQSPLAR